MGKLERQLRQDRHLRDAARALVDADLDRVRSEFKAKPLGRRAIGRLQDGAAELLDSAQSKAGDNIGIVALLLGAIGLWFARNPIMALFGDGTTDDQGEQAPPQPPMGDEE